GTPSGQPLTKRFITKHRLKKKNPEAEMSEPVKPIVYYLDPGTPEPVRSALLEGARWWSEAFEEAGYKDAFQVEMLPEDAHPMDVRYNMINWVHRSTRGWSYGSSVVDPRTGEIIKGHVLLGSLRVRQDYLLAEGLLSPYKKGAIFDEENPMLEMALARIRQLSAHEVGHTLGLAHNFAASYNNRASVMDYPVPKVAIASTNKLDLSDAYAAGIGKWDKMAVTYGYKDLSNAENKESALDQIVKKAIDDGLYFISDNDARAEGGAHPKAHLWDNGNNAVEQLKHVMKVREIALDNFSESNIPVGTPVAKLEDALVPIYLYHRYQLEATVKLVGGLYYSYNMRGDGQAGPELVEAFKQRDALEAMLQTITPEALKMPDQITKLIPPRPLGYYGSRELFNSHTDPAFDPLGAAETAAHLTTQLLFNPQRAARLVDFEARNTENLGLAEMIDQGMEATWKANPKEGYGGAIQRSINFVTLYDLMRLAANDEASTQVKAIAHQKLRELQNYLANRRGADEQWKAAYSYGSQLIEDYF